MHEVQSPKVSLRKQVVHSQCAACSTLTCCNSSTCSSKDYAVFTFKQSKAVTVAWGLLAAVGYGFAALDLLRRWLEASVPLTQLINVLDMVFAVSLACCGLAIAMSTALGRRMTNRWACCSLGYSCSLWYMLGLWLVSTGNMGRNEGVAL